MRLDYGEEWERREERGVTLVSLEGAGELVDGGRHLQSLHEDSLLSLDSDIFGPLDEASQVSLGLDITTNSEVLGVLLEQGVLVQVLALLSCGLNNSLHFTNLLRLFKAKTTISKGRPWALTILDILLIIII